MKKVLIALFVVFAAGIIARGAIYKSVAMVEYTDGRAAVCIDTTGNEWILPAAGLQTYDIITYYNFNMFTPYILHDDVTITNTITVNNNLDFEY